MRVRPQSATDPELREQEAAELHFSLRFLETWLRGLQPPRGKFDPAGQWRHRYTLLVPAFNARNMRRGDFETLQVGAFAAGAFSIERTPTDAGCRLEIQSDRRLEAEQQRTSAVIECADDVLASPRSWEVQSDLLDAGGRPLQGRLRWAGRIEEDSLVQGADGARRPLTGERTTCDWSLFDAVQRLPAEGDSAAFDVLEELDGLKPDQRLLALGKFEVQTAARRPLAVEGFRRTGRGILPVHYWRDRRGRLLLVVGSMVAWGWQGQG